MFLALFFIISQSAAQQIKPNELEDIIGKSKYIFVNFYCASCPHSIESLPVWDQISNYFVNETRFSFYKIECERYYSHCVKLGAEGYPVYGVFQPHSKKLLKYNRDKELTRFVYWVKQYLGIEVNNEL